jgi:hypothetical protein
MYNGRSSGGYASNQPLVPRHRGADIALPAEWTSYVGRPAPIVRDSSGNEVYASAIGTWVGFSGAVGELRNSLHWNIRQQGVYAGRNVSVAFDGFRIVSQRQVSNDNALQLDNLDGFGATTYPRAASYATKGEGFNIGSRCPTWLPVAMCCCVLDSSACATRQRGRSLPCRSTPCDPSRTHS